MGQEEIFHLPCTDPQFLRRVYESLLNTSKSYPFDLKNEAVLSYYFDVSGVQESFGFRALSRARVVSLALLDEKGEVKKDVLQSFISFFEKEGYLFYPLGYQDGLLTERFLDVLRAFTQSDLLKSLKRFQKPLVHRWAEKLIFETLGIPSSGTPSDGQIRAAVLCACLTPLRQSVGSCFATAPAMLIQNDNLPLLLDDFYQLLATGKLKRTFGGVEYSIPLSPSTGIGDLKKKLTETGGYCPGVIAALESADIIDSQFSYEEKAQAAQSLILELSQSKSYFSVEDLIRAALLKKFHLKEEDLNKTKRLEAEEFKSAKMGMRVSDSRTSGELEKILRFREKEKESRSVFNGMCSNALLKSWEYTLASFSEVKMEFSRWNLYSSLGFAPEEKGGIGELIYTRLDEKIVDVNKKLEDYQKQYEIAFDQARSAEVLLRNASSESEARRLSAEYQSRSYHLRSCLEMRDALYSKGSNYSKLFSFLAQQYDEKFPEYFQEIYDAQMQDFQGELYDDSPAGFRLVYKHGRVDPSLWTLIYDADSYIDALLDFFTVTEPQIAANCDWEGGSGEVLELNAAIIAHIRTSYFLETAMQRMAKAHQTLPSKSPLTNFQKIEKKPWAYTSGGTMTTLLKTYYCRESELTREEKWVENETELLIFILDTLKSLPPKITDPYLKNPHKGMLMTSPTHAFVLLPGLESIHKGWKEDVFSYTWVRDEMFLPSLKFYSEMQLTYHEQMFLLSQFSRQLPPLLQHTLNQIEFSKEKKSSVTDWRKSLLQALKKHPAPLTKPLADVLDSFLYQNLPVVPGKQWKVNVRRILSDKMSGSVEQVLQKFPDDPAPFLTAHEIREATKGCYLLAQGKLTLTFDLHQFIAQHARFVGLSSPTPLLFADTNWNGYYFSFIVNPGTGRLELWRLDRTLSSGAAMSEWKQWLNGSDKKTWSIFTRPYEYEMAVRDNLRRL